MELKLKDWVTMGNLVCGMSSVACLIMDPFEIGPLGNFDVACFLVVFGFVFDALDGLVARLTKQFNKFGSEFDNLCDLITYSIAPGFLLFDAFYKQAGYPFWAAALVGFGPVAAGTVRAARFNVRRAEFPGFFIGFPRTAFALVTVALLQSTLFRYLGKHISEYLYFIPIALVIVTSAMMLSLHGFISHHGIKWHGAVRFGIWWFLLSIPVGIIGGYVFNYPPLMFDLLLFDLFVYMVPANSFISKESKDQYKAYIKEWKAMG